MNPPVALVVAGTFQHFLVAGWEGLLPNRPEVRLFFLSTRELFRLDAYPPETPIYLILPLPKTRPTLDVVRKHLASFESVTEVET